MNILIIGSGGREHALAWKVAQSKQVEAIWVAPGNGGTQQESKTNNVDIACDDIEKLLQFAQQKQIDLTIVGPEAPLAKGIVDTFQAHNLHCFGPTQQAAQLETSKAFCKNFLAKHLIPTASFANFSTLQPALDYLKQQKMPIVIKASGLAQGKGVIIAQSYAEAKQAVESMLQDNCFGEAGQEIVIEEFLEGEELSFIVMADGQNALPLASAQDHKRRFEGDLGPNTGGMGAYSPSPLLDPPLQDLILQQVIYPTINALAQDNMPYTGFLYAGLMITPEGQPKVLEFNCRLGDPETQPILMRLQSDLITLCQAALRGELNQAKVAWDPQPAICVVMAANGYPGKYPKGDVINGLAGINNPYCKIFHAGTCQKADQVITDGGRVLGITALGDSLQIAHDRAYQAVTKIHWPHATYRNDIGHRALHKKEKAH